VVVVTTKVADVLPDAIVAEPGTVAAPLLLESDTPIPPAGAATAIPTVPVEVLPPTTDDGFKVRVVMAGGLMVSTAVTLAPFKLALIVADVTAGTAVVLTVNVPLVAPAAIFNDAGTIADPELLPKAIVRPVFGAIPVRVTVAADEAGPVTVVGLRLSADRDGGVTFSTVDWVVDPSVAVIVTAV